MAVRRRSYRGRVQAVLWPGTGRIVGSRLPCPSPRSRALRFAALLRLAVSRAYSAPCRSPRSRALRCAALLRPARSRAYPTPCRRLPLDRVVACMAVSQAQGRAPSRPCPGLAVLYCNTAQPFLFKSVTIQFFLYCDTSLLNPQACLSHNCIAIQLPTHPAYCNTTPNILHTSCNTNLPLTIQFSFFTI